MSDIMAGIAAVSIALLIYQIYFWRRSAIFWMKGANDWREIAGMYQRAAYLYRQTLHHQRAFKDSELFDYHEYEKVDEYREN